MVVEIKLHPKNNHLSDNGYSLSEEESFYDSSLQDVIDNPRWYLDNLQFLVEYRVSWKNYKDGFQITPPYRFVNKTKKGKRSPQG